MLDDEAVAALEAGQKIQAIKIVRAKQGIGLKEAKQLVDAYISDNPHLQTAENSSFGRVVLMAFGVLLIFSVYKMFAG